MADGDESLLDVFVNIKPDPGFLAAITASAEAAINEYARVFAAANLLAPSVRPPNVSGGTTGGGGGGTGGGSGNPAGPIVNDLRAQLRQAILEFQRDKAFLEVDVRIANDRDLQGRLQDITNRVKANEAIARAPDSDETQQAEAIRRIIDLRLQNLNELRRTATQQRINAGLDAAELDRNLRFRQEGVAAGQSLLGVKTVGKTVTAAKDTGLTQEFETLTTALNQAKFNLKQGFGAQSLVDVTAARTDIERIAAQLNDLRTRAQDKIVIDLQVKTTRATVKEDFDLEVKRGREEISTGRISNEYEASLTRGSLASADTRRAIALIKFEVKSAEEEVRRLSLAFNGTSESVENLSNATQQLAMKNQELKLTYQQTQETSKSMNTLSNNAYQLGQAFEDFSVGYSLNGFAGGIRGAANNVAFLLNDMSRLESVQKALPAGWAKQLPLIAGIGSALAIVVLPKIVEWLESLNDIEVQFRDIANEIADSFEDTDFRIKFGIDNDSLRNSLESAKSVRDILEEIRDINFDVSSKRKQLLEIFSGLNELELFDDDNSPLGKIKDQLSEIDSAVKTELQKTQNQVDRQNQNLLTKGARNLGANVFQLFGAETFETELGKLKEFKLEVFNVQRAIENAVEAGNAGIVNPELLVRAQRQLAQFSEFAKNNINRVDVTGDPQKFAEAISGAVDKFAERLKAAEEISREVSNAVGEKLSIAIQEAIKKTDELADRQLLLRRAVEGTVSSQSEFLLEVNETSAAYAKLISEIRKAYLDQGRDPSDLVKQFQAQEIFASENIVLSKQKDTIEKIREAEEKLASLRDKNADKEKSRKSQFTDFESFAKNLQTNVLSIDPIDKNTKAIEDLNSTLGRLNFELAQQQATSENLKTQFSDPSGFADRQRAIAFARPFDANQALMNMFDKTGVGLGVMTAADQARSGAFVVNDIADAVNRGVREAMQGFVAPVVGEQKQTTDAVRKLNVGARAQ